jgi:Recombination enhancement, RecA-dependent nuclease
MRSATRKRIGKDDAYRAFIQGLPCVLCERQHVRQNTRTEAAHVGATRGMSQKCSDRETIPLCAYHHTEGPASHHRLQKRFWTFHGINREATIRMFNEAYDTNRETR